MNKDKYVIINKSKLQKRIEELEKFYMTARKVGLIMDTIDREIEILKQILSQSTPLIPVLEDCFEHGVGSGKYKQEYGENANGSLSKQDYISNLKLNI